MKYGIAVLTLLTVTQAFTFLYPFVTPSSLTINTITTYHFEALR